LLIVAAKQISLVSVDLLQRNLADMTVQVHNIGHFAAVAEINAPTSGSSDTCGRAIERREKDGCGGFRMCI
jgi:hypothetical protein